MAYTTINKSTAHFNTKLYTGNGSTAHAITGVGFQPDWVWCKSRSITKDHLLFDALRGVTNAIKTNSTAATDTNSEFLQAFGTDGFTVGNQGKINTNSATYVSWNWKAANSAGSSNADGSITSTVSANTTAGFSIVTYTGSGSETTVGHGLNAVPNMIITKRRSGANNWRVYHSSLASHDAYLSLNATDASSTSGSTWSSSAPTNQVFRPGTDSAVNGSGETYVAYCFAEKTGYSKFGTYTGNGNADGTFVFCGFKPTFLMVKRTDSTSNWTIVDSIREPTNDISKYMDVNLGIAEGNYTGWNFLSNGFKFVNTDAGINANGGTFIYMAFGQSLVGQNNVPCTAR